MKNLTVTLVLLFSVSVWAQEGSFRAFQTNFAYGLRVVEAPCPRQLGQLGATFPEAKCYRHGYKDFFDFKEAVDPYLFDAGRISELWHIVTVQLGSEPVEVTKTVFRLRKSKQQITLVYVSDELLLLSAKDLRPSP